MEQLVLRLAKRHEAQISLRQRQAQVGAPGLDHARAQSIEVCREIRRHYKYPYISLILLTARTSKDDVVRGLEAGADDLTKPFDLEELEAARRVAVVAARIDFHLLLAKGRRLYDKRQLLMTARGRAGSGSGDQGGQPLPRVTNADR